MIRSVFEAMDAKPAKVIADLMRFDTRSRSELSEALTECAIKLGFVERRPAPPGLTLQDWIKTNKAPLWARQAAQVMLMAHGWVPETSADWARWAFLHIRSNESGASLPDMLATLPEQIDAKTAVGWLVAAREADQLYKALKALKGRK
ncbi:hypothetical protein [Ferrimonas kyonanensis]|uniref:hypothetical protein n=1 Tax=Ferrimonas kyonanensis TaxID=364763 RepID=UPI000686EE1C|nr:hypothetical protein [Ferrimonas kyonanensis]